MSNNDYVTPPKREIERPSGREYVAPIRKVSSNESDYVSPPKKTSSEQLEQTISNSETTTTKDKSGKQQKFDPYDNPKYFGTPKVSIFFYLNGYLFWSLLWILFLEEWDTVGKLILSVYLLLSNYTYSWFADFQRYKGGMFVWFFTPYGSMKAGWGSSLFSNYQTGTVTKGIFGGYRTSTRTNYGAHLWHMILVAIVIELTKYAIVAPIALVTVFIHKSTIKKYNQLVDYRNK